MTSNSTENGLWMAVLNSDNSAFEDGACCASGHGRHGKRLDFEFRMKFLLKCPSYVFPTGDFHVKGTRLPHLHATVLQHLHLTASLP